MHGGLLSRSDALPAKAHPRRVDPWLPLLLFLLLNGLALLFFLPWLPTTIERLLSWPSQNGYVGPLEGLGLTLQTLATGSIRSGPELAWGWLLLVGLLPLGGLWRLRRSGAGAALLLWTLLPIGVMFGFGLFSPSFLKFLLVISPAWCLLAAAAAQPFTSQKLSNLLLPLLGRGDMETHRGATPLATLWRPISLGTLAALVAFLTLSTLPSYYADPVARDNYAGIARTVLALGDPVQDLVVLNAPGQADVWRFYDVGLEMLPLPAERPPDRIQDRRDAGPRDGQPPARLRNSLGDRTIGFGWNRGGLVESTCVQGLGKLARKRAFRNVHTGPWPLVHRAGSAAPFWGHCRSDRDLLGRRAARRR